MTYLWELKIENAKFKSLFFLHSEFYILNHFLGLPIRYKIPTGLDFCLPTFHLKFS